MLPMKPSVTGGHSSEHPPWGEVLPYEATRFTIFYALFTGVHFGLRSYAAWHAERLRADWALQ